MIRTLFQLVFRSLLLSLAVLLFTPIFLPHAAPLTTEKTITIVNQENTQDPLWKKSWDEARSLAQEQKFSESISKYLEVLEAKPHIEEVKWELSKIYLSVRDYEKALVILAGLIEASPEKLEYLVSGGEVALKVGKADLASKYFGRALALDPGGQLSEPALLGMINALTAQDKRSLAIPLMEQLYQRGVLGTELIHELARYYDAVGDYGRSSHYYRELVGKFRVEPEIRIEAAAVFEKSNLEGEAVSQREIYLSANPDDMEQRIILADYYYDTGAFKKALPHMLQLLGSDIRREHYLLTVANIYLYGLGRTDQALKYFEDFQREFPQGQDVSDKITTLQLILANDLLAIVENDGVWMLWRDLARVTPDRVGIYRAMADMLEEMGREREKDLLEVLRIIHIHDPKDFKIVEKISRLLVKNRLYDECLKFLDATRDNSSRQGQYFLFRSECEAGSGMDLQRLKSYSKYLEISPKDLSIRRDAIELSGQLGLVQEMRRFHESSPTGKGLNVDALSDAYFHGLMRNDLVNEAHDFLNRIQNQEFDELTAMRMIRALSNGYLRQNRQFMAEQVLREYSAANPESGFSYLLLAGHHIQRNEPAAAALWLSELERLEQRSEVAITPEQKSVQLLQQLLLGKMKRRVGVYQAAVNYLNAQLEAQNVVSEDVEMVLFAATHYLLTNRYDDCMKLIRRIQEYQADERLESLYFIARHDKVTNRRPFDGTYVATVSPSALLTICDLLIGINRFEEALIFAEGYVEKVSSSTRADVLRARGLSYMDNYERAKDVYRSLAANHRDESYFKEQVLRIETFLGQPETIFDIFSVVADETGRKNRISQLFAAMDYPEAKLMWARALWWEENWEESLDVYGLLDTELKRNMDALIDSVQKHPGLNGQSGISLAGLQNVSAGEPEFIDAIMSTEFFARNLGAEVNRLSAGYYNYFRWAKIVDKERTAKSSLKAREFYQAEIDYQELFEEDTKAVEEIYPDLATIYGRLGRYRQETELLETIKERSIYYPDFLQASEKSTRRQQPFLALDGLYWKEEGREGYKDITQKYLGLGLSVKPTLYQDLGFRAGRNEYGNNSASTLAKSIFILGNYAIQFGEILEGSFEVGYEDFDTDGKSFLIYDLTVKGTLEQQVDLFATIKQNPVDDTINSLGSGVYVQDLQLGLSFDYLFGLFFGLDLTFRDYNDNNEGERYYLWGSYRWFGERSSLDFTYSYLNIQNEIANEFPAEAVFSDEQEGPSYWSPGDYWKHRLAALYKLELSPTGKMQSGTGSISAMYALGYEKYDVLVHEFEANILLEISEPFLVKGTFSTVVSDDYDNLKGYISLVYRW